MVRKSKLNQLKGTGQRRFSFAETRVRTKCDTEIRYHPGMELEVGPISADEAGSWIKFARRILIELNSTPPSGELPSPDVVDQWSQTIDQWSDIAQAAIAAETPFRVSASYEPEFGEYLLHGLEQCLLSPIVAEWVRPEEAELQLPFTLMVVRAFVEGLATEGRSAQHYIDQILASFGQDLDV